MTWFRPSPFRPSAGWRHAADLAAGVVDIGVGGEGRHDGVDIEGVDGSEVGGDDGGKRTRTWFVLLASRRPRLTASVRSLGHTLAGGARPRIGACISPKGRSDTGGMRSSLAIGDFSRATHLNIKTLRHYHRIGLLEPAYVDPDTGHRRYGTDQIPTAQVIRRFRSLDMPLEEIHAVITTPDLAARNESHRRSPPPPRGDPGAHPGSVPHHSATSSNHPQARHRSRSSTAGYRPRPRLPSARSSTSRRPAPGTRARSANCTPSWPLTRSRPPVPQAASTPTTCSPTNAARPPPSCPAANRCRPPGE